MKYILSAAFGLMLAALAGSAGAIMPAPGIQQAADELTAIETVARKGGSYKFCALCPAPIWAGRVACSASGKNREAARDVCKAKHPLCVIRDLDKKNPC
ncbi:MAG: hypothetical protein Q7S17_02490 [Xanthobacteraceae bacterium]|nr:hypothetical protein [Xanthobacteraceae bacterium]